MADDAGKHQPPSLDEFSKRLDAARGGRTEPKHSRAGIGPALGRALRVSTELLVALLVGAGLGWGLDRLTGAEPWFLLAGMLFGFAAGVRNLVRALKAETPPPAKPD
jgi:ATP synthase protein I